MQAELNRLVGALVDKVIYPITALVVAVGLLVFMYGLLEYLWGLSNDVGDKKEKGRQHMIWGVVGMFVMVAAYAILALVGQIMCNGSITNCNKL